METKGNKKMEIFKLALAAGSVKLTEEQMEFVLECFKKTEELSGLPPRRDYGRGRSYERDDSGRSRSRDSGRDFRRDDRRSRSRDSRQSGRDSRRESDREKTMTGRDLFLREKMKELKPNGQSYQTNKSKALDEWDELTDSEVAVWNSRAKED